MSSQVLVSIRLPRQSGEAKAPPLAMQAFEGPGAKLRAAKVAFEALVKKATVIFAIDGRATVFRP